MNDPNNLSSPDRQRRSGHETSDVSPMSIRLFAMGLVLMIALVLPLLHWSFWQFEAAARRTDPVQSPLADNQVPPAPRLQVQPATDLKQLRLKEDQRLSSYGWIDPEQKVVHVPIDRAMEILAERGLPEPHVPQEVLPEQERSP
jgi:hypothetical protein